MLLNISFEPLTRSRENLSIKRFIIILIYLLKDAALGAQNYKKKTFQPYMCQIFYSQQLEMRYLSIEKLTVRSSLTAQGCIFSKNVRDIFEAWRFARN